MAGSELKLGFLFLYELFTGGVKMKILSNDDSHSLATLLLQLMGDKNDRGLLPSILNILSHNPDLCQRLPKVRENQPTCTWAVSRIHVSLISIWLPVHA